MCIVHTMPAVREATILAIVVWQRYYQITIFYDHTHDHCMVYNTDYMIHNVNNQASATHACHAILRPLQINSLFPVHRPHLVTASSEYSIIPYSSITFWLFLHTDRLSKSYLETVSVHVSAVLSSQHKLHVCVIFATYKGRNKLANMPESRTGNREFIWSGLIYLGIIPEHKTQVPV